PHRRGSRWRRHRHRAVGRATRPGLERPAVRHREPAMSNALAPNPVCLHARTATLARGFSLVELMIALALGLLLSAGTISVYLFSKSSFNRQQQLSSMQQDV